MRRPQRNVAMYRKEAFPERPGRTSVSCSPSSRRTTSRATPRLPSYRGGPVIDGRAVPCGSGRLPRDFAQRIDRLKEASGLTWDDFAEPLGVERKQVLRWRRGAEPCGGSYHALIELARWVPGGLEILMGADFFASCEEG